MAEHKGAIDLVTSYDRDSERFLRERPGNVVILSGRNRFKIDLIRMAVEAGMHVLADKPVLSPAEHRLFYLR